MGIQLRVSDLAENIVGKEEIACYEQFLLFSTMFLKSCLLLMRQNEYLWTKGLRFIIFPPGERSRYYITFLLFSLFFTNKELFTKRI